MKSIRKEIWRLRGRIAKDIFITIDGTIGSAIAFLFEAAAKMTPIYIGYKLAKGEDFFPIHFVSLDAFEAVLDYGMDIEPSKREIKRLKGLLEFEKEEKKQEKEQEKRTKEITQDISDKEIINYVTDLLLRITNLTTEEQRIIILKIKEILNDYSIKYNETKTDNFFFPSITDVSIKEAYITNYLSLIKETTIKKLSIIDKLIEKVYSIKRNNNSYTLKEEQISTMINTIEEDNPTLKQ